MERKLLTILFVDLVDSTRMVTAADPEIVRRRVSGFLAQVTECISAHGGHISHLAGDAIMAAFGIPQAHEDDAVRAIRAGRAILDSVAELELEARVGVEAGEVLTDEDSTSFATGEAINVAIRLQQAAAPGELFVGPGAYRLTLGRLEAEDVGPIELKGLDRPVWAWRVLGVSDGGRPTKIGAPMVGREAELELLHNTFTRVVQSGRAHLFTLYGEPGVGKSRLAREFLDGLEGATVLTGRCLPYGEGITYWPVAEMVKVAAGITDDDPVKEAVEKLRACCEDEAVADLLALASGVLDALSGEHGQDEISWATREWAHQLADAQPLVLVFEDIHWAEEPLLELIEHLAAWVRQAPLMLLCLARADLLETRPGWGGGRVRATAIELEPLTHDESNELIDALAVQAPLLEEARRELIDKTGGNPLFLEETIRMFAEQDGATGRIPDTVQALIAARIDRLPHGEKTLLQRASVIGRSFWAGAAAELTPEAEAIDECLDHLLERDLIVRNTRSSISGEKSYRFKHVLIREVAYGGLSKLARAELHSRFADWVRRRAGDELVEIRATHLDRACALFAELDGAPPVELARETAAVLEKAGRRALAREAFGSARKQFVRALDLEPTIERRYMAARAAWRLGDFAVVETEMDEVLRAARAAGERWLEGRALTALADSALNHDADVERARMLIDEALAVLEDETDAGARFDALGVRGQVGSWLGSSEEAAKYLRKALAVAQGAGRKDLETFTLQGLASTYLGQLRLAEAEPLVDEALQLADESGSIVARAAAMHTLASLDRALGRLDDAEEHYEAARSLYAEVGRTANVGKALLHLGRVSREQGELELAGKRLRESLRLLAQSGDRGMLCEAQRSLAELSLLHNNVEEAERLALAACESVGPQDIVSRSTTKLSLGLVRAAQDRDDEAEKLMREAFAELAESDFRVAEREAARALAGFLRERGRCDEASLFDERIDELSGGVAVS